MIRRLTFAVLVTVLTACGDATGPGVKLPSDTIPPALQREMRGLWIATVANIDWPSARGLSASQQRSELVDILNRAAAIGINTIIFHVRPAGDALYESTLEPWGIMLTGTQGGDPGYDPLAYAIEEAHKRGMELHAWINPFRAGNTSDTVRLASSHLFHTRRDLVRVYGGNIWMDPGEPDVRDHSLNVIADIVERYDIDGIHADDYFYPYVVNVGGSPLPFPDDETYDLYGGGLSRADWRRANVDGFLERMYEEVHELKPTIKVGISPFGIWRPGNPPGVAGLDAYASIYADSRKWLQQGWLDYLAPQLYWAIAAPQQSYPALLDWWISQNTQGRHVWPGLAAYRVNNGTGSAFSFQEIPNQIQLTRTRAGGTGHILYNTTWTLKQHGGLLASMLAEDIYTAVSLPPASPWLDAIAPPAPALGVDGNTLSIMAAEGEPARWWAVRLHQGDTWTTRILFGDQVEVSIQASTHRVIVQAVDQAGNSSDEVEWRR